MCLINKILDGSHRNNEAQREILTDSTTHSSLSTTTNLHYNVAIYDDSAPQGVVLPSKFFYAVGRWEVKVYF